MAEAKIKAEPKRLQSATPDGGSTQMGGDRTECLNCGERVVCGLIIRSIDRTAENVFRNRPRVGDLT